MFGIRTIFLGLDLLSADERCRREALRRAPIIHASDAVAALLAGASRQIPLRAAGAAAGISCVNLLLASAAQRTWTEPVRGRQSRVVNWIVRAVAVGA